MTKKEPEYKMTPQLEKILGEAEKDRSNHSGPLRTKEEVREYLDSLKNSGQFSEPLSVEETIEELKRL